VKLAQFVWGVNPAMRDNGDVTRNFRLALPILSVVLLALIIYFLVEELWGLLAVSLVLLVLTVYVMAGMKKGTAQAGPVKLHVEFDVDEDDDGD
jgi:hypothetical protein